MADDYLVRDGPVSVPMEYIVPQGGELIPLMVIATVDGTSAAGPFYAAVQIIAPSGRVMGTAISDAIAAGASASVTWFPAAELTAAAAANLPVSEVVYLNSKTGSVTASTVLASGVSYLLSAQGTYTDWNEDLANGTPEANAMFPTSLAGRISTQVGIDPDTIFAYPNDHPQVIGHWTQFEMNLGAGFAHVEPFDGAHTTPATDHFYSYQVTGQGSAPSFRINDTPLNDNYGELKITIYAIPGGGGSGSGVASVTAADTSIIVGGTATNPTLRTATLDVIAADHPPVADWSNNAKKITNVANGTAAQDAAAFGQIPTSGSPVTGGASNIQTFSAGAGQTWNKPSGAKTVQVVCIGGGGGGGGGQSTATVSRSGGGGGGGASVTVATYSASDLGGSETVGVGTGGGGGAVNAVGTPGGSTTFGTHQSAFGGGGGGTGGNAAGGAGGASAVAVGGNGGSNVAGTGGAPASATAIGSQGANGSSASNGTAGDWGGAGGGGASTTGSGGNGGTAIYGGPAGGGGGGNTGAGAAGTAGTGGTTQAYTSGGGSGPNTNGTSFVGPYCGSGAGGGNGGGGAGTAVVGGIGGRGAGGGGGGTGLTGKAGGSGGDGICIVTSW